MARRIKLCLLGTIVAMLLGIDHVSSVAGDTSAFIVEGHMARDGDHPWQLSFQLRLRSGRWYHACGASLIHENFAVTAAHCVYNYRNPLQNGTIRRYRVENMRVVAGANVIIPIDRDAEIYPIKSVRTLFGLSIAFDFALLELNATANTSRNDITPIAMANSSEPAVGSLCTIAGWGSPSGTHRRTSRALQEGRMSIVSMKDCESSGWNLYFSQLCAQGSPRQVGGCYGDSGGPLSCVRKDGTPVLVGVLSRGWPVGCGVQRPNVFSRISYYRRYFRVIPQLRDL